ncbi:protein NosL [bacterium CG17_big_fil_post_rev_8_21_14_2_50_64_8]|nr:MAG: protein NosL [bacterium CG17_big_fil_post_rev_8_21_14_2_50_64_8]PJA73176.1 MAG: protein NosL [bacterium CG_4_9_14_3_um_filter_65_15]
MRPQKLLETGLLALALSLGACSRGPETGPGKVRWDQDVCRRCIMAVSDRHYSAQVRGGPEGGRSRLFFFDDFGCAVLWLGDQPWQGNPGVEIWVTDFRTGTWLDARTALYERGRITPMDYGLGARPDAVPGAMDFDQAVQEVLAREERLHGHAGGGLLEAPKWER